MSRWRGFYYNRKTKPHTALRAAIIWIKLGNHSNVQFTFLGYPFSLFFSFFSLALSLHKLGYIGVYGASNGFLKGLYLSPKWGRRRVNIWSSREAYKLLVGISPGTTFFKLGHVFFFFFFFFGAGGSGGSGGSGVRCVLGNLFFLFILMELCL